jgi:hypothetical protein
MTASNARRKPADAEYSQLFLFSCHQDGQKTLNISFAAVYGVSEIGQQAHLDCSNISLKLIGWSVRAHGATSGDMQGEICAILYLLCPLNSLSCNRKLFSDFIITFKTTICLNYFTVTYRILGSITPIGFIRSGCPIGKRSSCELLFLVVFVFLLLSTNE